MQNKARLLASAALALSMAAGVAHAQTTTIEELVVTAEKREQSLQDVPVAISAYTSERRDLVGINSVQDMTNFTPGLTYSNANDRISLRGIGRTSNVQAADGAVAIYSDGIFTSSTFEASKQPLFIDRVEVLRGPQGTLYGRNSIGGAINVLSKRPSDTFGGEVRATYANYDYTVLQATLTGPIAEGLNFRINASREQQTKGYYKNTVPGVADAGNVIKQYYLEGQLSAKFGDHADGWIKISSFSWDNGGGGLGARAGYSPFPYNTTQENSTNFYLNQGFGCSGFATNVLNPSTAGCTNPAINNPRKYANDTAEKVSLDDTIVIAAEYTYHFDNFDVKYIGGGTNYHYTLVQDNDGGPVQRYTIPLTAGATCSPAAVGAGVCGPLTIFPTAISTYQEDKRWMSHEINFSSNGDGAVQWLGGLYYYNEHYRQPVTVQLPNQPQFANPINAVPGLTAAANPNRYWYDTRPEFSDKSYAAFGQVDWKITDQFKLTAGLRYSHDHKYGKEEARLVCFALIGCGTNPESLGTFTPAVDITRLGIGTGVDPVTGKLLKGVKAATVYDPATGLGKRLLDADWSATTGTAGLEWTPDTDTLAYAKYSRGYKAGGFNSGITSPVVTNPYTDAEHNNAYEIGVKKDFGRTLQVNLAAYYYAYKNFQAPVTIIPTSGGIGTAQTVFFNLPKAISKGFEAEVNWAPIDNLRLNATYSYTDAYVDRASGLVDPTDPTAIAAGANPVGLTQAQCVATPTNCTIDVYTGQFQRGQSLKGNALPQAPKNKVALNAIYTIVTDAGSLSPSVSYFWRDEQYGTIFQRSYNKAPSWDQVDVRMTWKDAKNRYSIIGYVKNVFDDLGYSEGATSTRVVGRVQTGQPVVQGISTYYALTPPRTYGVELQYRF